VNPGVTEEAGLTARSLISVLGSQPLALAMIVSNFLLLAFVWYSDIENNRAWQVANAQRSENARMFAEYAQQTNTLLAKCVVPEQK